MKDHNTTKSQIVTALLSAPQSDGIVATTLGFFADRSWELRRFEQSILGDQFYARVEFACTLKLLDSADLASQLNELQKLINGNVDFEVLGREHSFALLIDRPCSLLMDMANGCGKGDLKFSSIAFIASRDVDIEPIANRFGIPFFVLPKGDDVALETRVLELVKRYKPTVLGVAKSDQVFSAQFQRKVSTDLFAVQSAFIPVHVGHPQLQFETQWAVRKGAALTVASSFFYSPEVGGETIIKQEAIQLSADDDELAIDSKRNALESEVFLHTLIALAQKRVIVGKNRCVTF